MFDFIAQAASQPVVEQALPNLGLGARLLIFALIGAITAVQQDLRTFVKARRVDRSATFDWCLAGAQLVSGAFAGIVGGVGLNFAAGQLQ